MEQLPNNSSDPIRQDPTPPERERLVRYCSRFTGDPHAAEDLAQQTLLEAWGCERTLRDPRARQGWLFGIARNLCLMRARGRAREVSRLASLDEGGWESPELNGRLADEFDLEVELEREDLARLLDRAMALLPPATRRVLTERYLEESPQAEVAERLGLTEGAVEARLHRGRLALRRILTTDLADEAAAHGLVSPGDAGWRETRLWCPECGRHRLLGYLDAERGEFAVRCPGCCVPGSNLAYAVSDELFGGVKSFMPAFSRLMLVGSIYFGEALAHGVVPCAVCARAPGAARPDRPRSVRGRCRCPRQLPRLRQHLRCGAPDAPLGQARSEEVLAGAPEDAHPRRPRGGGGGVPRGRDRVPERLGLRRAHRPRRAGHLPGPERGRGCPAVIDTLRQRNFALVWSGGLVSMTGDWLLLTALPVYVYQQTGSALATSVMFMTYWIPGVLLGSVAGVFVDRWDRRRTMIAGDLAQGAVVLLLLVLVFAPSRDLVWVAYAVTLVQSSVRVFSSPAEGALLPTLVGEERLVPANSLNTLNDNIARFAGPPLGGVLIGLYGLGSVVLVDALTFLFAAAMVSRVSVPRKSAGARQGPAGAELTEVAMSRWASVWTDWLDGLRVIARSRVVAVLFLIMAVGTLGNGILSPLIVPFVQEVLRGGAIGYGALLTAQGVGGLLGGFLVGQWGTIVSPSKLIVLGLLAIGLILLAMFNLPSLPLAVALFALLAVPFVAQAIGTQTLLQTAVPDGFRGRVLAASGTTAALLSLAGAAAAGALGDLLGVVPMLNASAALFILAGLAALLLPATRPEGDAVGRTAPGTAA